MICKLCEEEITGNAIVLRHKKTVFICEECAKEVAKLVGGKNEFHYHFPGSELVDSDKTEPITPKPAPEEPSPWPRIRWIVDTLSPTVDFRTGDEITWC